MRIAKEPEGIDSWTDQLTLLISLILENYGWTDMARCRVARPLFGRETQSLDTFLCLHRSLRSLVP